MAELSAEVFDSESKGARALGRTQGDRFVVLTGSYAVGDDQVQPSLGEKPGRVILREDLKTSGRLVQDGHRYRFTQDTEFNSPSEAASIVWGSNLNGRLVFGIDDKPQTSHVLYFRIDSPRAIEGYKKDAQLSVAARDRALAHQRNEQDNHTCQACGFRLSVQGRFVIECHHLEPVALGVRETTLAT